MKHIRWILTLPVTVVVIAFAVANREFVPIDLWPLEVAVELPVFVLVLGSMLVGFAVGALAMWISAGKQRQRARALRRRLDKLERELQSRQDARARATARPGAPAPVALAAPPRPAERPGESGRPAA